MHCSIIYKSNSTAIFLPAWEQLNKQYGIHMMESFAAIKIFTSQGWELMFLSSAPRSMGEEVCGKFKDSLDYKVSLRPAWSTM